MLPERFVRASDFDGKLGQDNNPDWKTVAIDEGSGQVVLPNGSIGFRWNEQATTRASGTSSRAKRAMATRSSWRCR
jgi:nitrate reductase / nitrite oxidoreductase, alpha subunit